MSTTIDNDKALRLITGLASSWALGLTCRMYNHMDVLYADTLLEIENLIPLSSGRVERTPTYAEFTDIINVDRWLRGGKIRNLKEGVTYPAVVEMGNHVLILDVTGWVVDVDILILCVLCALDDIDSYCILTGGLSLSAELRAEIQDSIANVHAATVSFS